jgi:uncharacterized membrane protein YkoI
MWAKTLLLSAIVATGAVAAPVSAHQRGPAFQVIQNLIPTQDRGNRGQDIRPLREVVDALRGRYGGELISARLEDGTRPVYVLRWRMPDGEVRDFRVDAAR